MKAMSIQSDGEFPAPSRIIVANRHRPNLLAKHLLIKHETRLEYHSFISTEYEYSSGDWLNASRNTSLSDIGAV